MEVKVNNSKFNFTAPALSYEDMLEKQGYDTTRMAALSRAVHDKFFECANKGSSLGEFYSESLKIAAEHNLSLLEFHILSLEMGAVVGEYIATHDTFNTSVD